MILKNEKKVKSCIYTIICTVNNKTYVGRTRNIYKRFSQYSDSIKRQDIKKINPYLLSDMLKFGVENFVMSVFKPSKNLKNDELKVILELDTTNPSVGYNKRLDIEGKMFCHPDTSKKISERLKSEWASGVRSGHSEKLKKSWENRDREEQGRAFSKILTKYVYIIEGFDTPVKYRGLVDLGFASALSAFKRKGKNKITCKGVVIERVVL